MRMPRVVCWRLQVDGAPCTIDLISWLKSTHAVGCRIELGLRERHSHCSTLVRGAVEQLAAEPGWQNRIENR